MERRRNSVAVCSLAGGLLILLNILLTTMNNAVLMLSSHSETLDAAMQNNTGLWWRIAFGVRGYNQGIQLVLAAIVAAIIIYLSLSLYLGSRNTQSFSLLIMLLSAIALLYGGGFIIGSIMAFIGAALAYETPKPFSETFIGKMLLSMTARLSVFEHFMHDTSVKDAAMAILFVNLLSGIGNGIFAFNVEKIVGATNANIPFEVLFTGKVGFDLVIAQTPMILMGLGIFKWALLSLILFFVGINLFGEKASLASIAACTGFAYAPIALQVFLPFLFTTRPYLTTWSVTVSFITDLWMMIILIVGMKIIMNVSYTKSAATVMSCGAIYTLINYLIFTQVSIPYVITFQIQPPAAMLAITCFFIAVPLLFMGKKSTSS